MVHVRRERNVLNMLRIAVFFCDQAPSLSVRPSVFTSHLFQSECICCTLVKHLCFYSTPLLTKVNNVCCGHTSTHGVYWVIICGP